VYLGDGGSYLLGAGLTVLLAESWGPGVALPVGVAALVLVAIPAAEVAFAAIRRLRGRSSLMAGDRGHPYDRLVQRGWPRPAASAAYIVAEVVLAAAAVGAALLLTGAVATGALTPDQETTP
jgi:UDP-GlcNAc:undecaprenyl-phosphate GlcNAc-1-phosphate transferase